MSGADIDTESLAMYPPAASRAPIVFGWMAHRQTTVPEDRVYGLLGLLGRGVMLPLNYGEGLDKALYRLQAYMIDSTPERGLLAWTGSPSNDHSMFACAPYYCRFFPKSIRSIPRDGATKCVFPAVPPSRSATMHMRLYPLAAAASGHTVLTKEHLDALLNNVVPEFNRPPAPVENLVIGVVGVFKREDNPVEEQEMDWEWNTAGRPDTQMPDEVLFAILLQVVQGFAGPSKTYSRIPTQRHIWLDPSWIANVPAIAINETVSLA